MNHVSRPLLAALGGVVVLFGVWMVALRPHGGSSSPAASAPVQAPRAAPVASRPVVSHPHPISLPQAIHHPARAARPALVRPTPAGRLNAVTQALQSGKVLALLFYNPSAADDQAVKLELGSITTAGGLVFKLAIPAAEAARYAQLTNEVPVNIAPTLVIINRARQAEEIVGFADSFEIVQRLNDALRSPVSAG